MPGTLPASMKPTDAIVYNEWKHHWHRYQELSRGCMSVNELLQHLKSVGNNLMDMYGGALSAEAVKLEILQAIGSEVYDLPGKYIHWLHEEGNDYKTCTISDGSAWVLRLGEDPEHYIHIHPGRYAPHTFRVKGLALKTAAIALLTSQTENRAIDLELINEVRAKYLQESAIKEYNSHTAIGKLTGMLLM